MTIEEIYENAKRKLDKNEITIGEFAEIVDREVHEPKTDVLDKIRAEIKAKIEEEEFARSVFLHEEKDKYKAEQCTGSIMAYNNMIKLIDKYKAESEVNNK